MAKKRARKVYKPRSKANVNGATIDSAVEKSEMSTQRRIVFPYDTTTNSYSSI